MQKLIGTTAMTAALVAVMFSLWRDYSLLVTLKKALISYVAFYIVGAVLVLVFKSGIEDEWQRDAARLEQEKRKRKEEKQSSTA